MWALGMVPPHRANVCKCKRQQCSGCCCRL